MKPKTNRTGDTSQSGAAGYDCCQTPPYALDPMLFPLMRFGRVWEPASGEGYLAGALRDAGHDVTATDIQTGHDFFSWRPDAFDVLVTNPPYSLKYPWIKRCYELGKPWALLVPLETLGAAKAQAMFKRYGVEVMLLSRRINFKMPNKGWDGSGAQFPVVWLSWRVTGQPLAYGDIALQRTVTKEAA